MTKIRTLVLGLAAGCGYAIRQARRPARVLPAAVAFGLISWGVGMHDLGAGLAAAGVSMLILIADFNSR